MRQRGVKAGSVVAARYKWSLATQPWATTAEVDSYCFNSKPGKNAQSADDKWEGDCGKWVSF